MNELGPIVAPSLRMGEMSVSKNGDELRTLLGSCIGLALYDPYRKVGGLAHIVLPRADGRTDNPGKYADTAIPALIEEMGAVAGGMLRLTAKMAGGASMFATTTAANVGLLNLESCEHLLDHLRIPVIARHCGGKQGRRMSLNTENGTVVIEIVGEDQIEI